MAETFVFAMIISLNVAIIRRAYKKSQKTLLVGYVISPVAAAAWYHCLGLPSLQFLAWATVATAIAFVFVSVACDVFEREEELQAREEDARQ